MHRQQCFKSDCIIFRSLNSLVTRILYIFGGANENRTRHKSLAKGLRHLGHVAPNFWRTRRDSNPRGRIFLRQIKSLLPSTTRSRVQKFKPLFVFVRLISEQNWPLKGRVSFVCLLYKSCLSYTLQNLSCQIETIFYFGSPDGICTHVDEDLQSSA